MFNFSHSLPLLDVSLNLITVIGWKPNTSLVLITPIFYLKLRIMISNLKVSCLSPFEIFTEDKRFGNKPTPLYTTQYTDLFITNKEGFNMHTCKRYPLQLPENYQYDNLPTQLISGNLIHTQNKLL